MLTVKKLRRKPKHFHQLHRSHPTAIRRVALGRRTALRTQAEHERLENSNRLRARGAGRNFNLQLPERLLMSLMYFRLYITQALL
jgi:hypothetical protein